MEVIIDGTPYGPVSPEDFRTYDYAAGWVIDMRIRPATRLAGDPKAGGEALSRDMCTNGKQSISFMEGFLSQLSVKF